MLVFRKILRTYLMNDPQERYFGSYQSTINDRAFLRKLIHHRWLIGLLHKNFDGNYISFVRKDNCQVRMYLVFFWQYWQE